MKILLVGEPKHEIMPILDTGKGEIVQHEKKEHEMNMAMLLALMMGRTGLSRGSMGAILQNPGLHYKISKRRTKAQRWKKYRHNKSLI